MCFATKGRNYKYALWFLFQHVSNQLRPSFTKKQRRQKYHHTEGLKSEHKLLIGFFCFIWRCAALLLFVILKSIPLLKFVLICGGLTTLTVLVS
jgi:hypothetical protein